ncbi:MAG: hypothetical protein Q8M54_07090 [Desulfobaccales bacterium]|nr:hypothetical protein [Desulfobaccales bacterium]
MARSEQGKGPVREEHTLKFTEDGKAATWWQTPEIQRLLLVLGSPIPELDDLIANPWCG